MKVGRLFDVGCLCTHSMWLEKQLLLIASQAFPLPGDLYFQHFYNDSGDLINYFLKASIKYIASSKEASLRIFKNKMVLFLFLVELIKCKENTVLINV